MRNGQAARKLAYEECRGCPSAKGRPCTAEELVDQALFVEAGHAFLCYHRTSFGGSYICRCPVRREIYERYGR